MASFDERMMALALTQARRGWGWTSPNPLVGAVVAQGDRIVATGYHARLGGPHAEVVALGKAGPATRGATLYVTLEPCNHYGRTPPCAQAVLAAGIRRVVIAQMDPNPVAAGGAELLRAHGIEVSTGILADRAADLNEIFTKFATTGRPWVLLKSAATLDGKLATTAGHSRWITGEKARAHVHRWRSRVDAILVGRGTVEADDPTLNTRLPGKKPGRDPVRIVLDTHLRLPLTARVFNPTLGGPTIVACGPDPDPARVEAVTRAGVHVVWALPLVEGRVSLAALIERLGREGFSSLMIEGGSEVAAAALLVERVVDKVMFFLAPKIVGGRTAPTLVGGAGVIEMNQALILDNPRISRYGRDLLLEARPAPAGATPAPRGENER